MNNSKHLALFLLMSVCVSNGLEAAVPGGMPATPPSAGTKSLVTPSATKTVPEYATYTYYGDRYRDPFVPLIGDSRPQGGLERPPQLTALQLKGIVQDAKGRMALLTNGVNSYILRAGRIYDGQNKMVKNISGVIKAESVVLIGSDHTVRELRAKTAL